MGRLRAVRAHGHPLLLIGVWTALEAATAAWLALVPGELSLSSLKQALVLTAAFAFFVAFGSRIVWWISIFFALASLGMGVALAIVALGGVQALGLTLLSAASLWVISSGSLDAYTKSGGRRRKLLAPPHAG